MQRFILRSISFFLVWFCFATSSQAWFFDDNTLLTIDEAKYSAEDFKRWWRFWKEEGMAFPETPDPYIDWLLLVREGQRMELDTDPSLKRDEAIFIKSRALLMLKYEEVDSKITATEADAREIYQEEYVPRWRLEGLQFKDAAQALDIWNEYKNGLIDLEGLIKRDPEDGGPIQTTETLLRLRDFEASTKWKDIYENLSVGEIVAPKKLGQSKVLWYLREIKGADDEDFSSVKEAIIHRLKRDQKNKLTTGLIEKLRQKYNVVVNQERLNNIDLNASEDTFSDAPVITTSQRDVSEKDFVTVLRRVVDRRPMMLVSLSDKEGAQKIKEEVAFGIIAQSVTDWEALDRHYETKEPFKWEYEFNRDHRITVAVQSRIFNNQVNVTDEEVRKYYEQNKKRYSMPARAKFYLLEETYSPVDKIWRAMATGGKIEKVLEENLDRLPELMDVPLNHIDPEVRAVAERLSEGETSQIFEAQGVRVLVYMHEKVPSVPISFEKVKDSVREGLMQNQIEQLKRDYLAKIRSGSNIEIQQRKWEALKKELEGA